MKKLLSVIVILFVATQINSQPIGLIKSFKDSDVLTYSNLASTNWALDNRDNLCYDLVPISIIESKPTVYIAVADSLPPLNTLVRTHVNVNGTIQYEQKAILKEDGWYWPSGVTKLAWIPTHWESI